MSLINLPNDNLVFKNLQNSITFSSTGEVKNVRLLKLKDFFKLADWQDRVVEFKINDYWFSGVPNIQLGEVGMQIGNINFFKPYNISPIYDFNSAFYSNNFLPFVWGSTKLMADNTKLKINSFSIKLDFRNLSFEVESDITYRLSGSSDDTNDKISYTGAFSFNNNFINDDDDLFNLYSANKMSENLSSLTRFSTTDTTKNALGVIKQSKYINPVVIKTKNDITNDIFNNFISSYTPTIDGKNTITTIPAPTSNLFSNADDDVNVELNYHLLNTPLLKSGSSYYINNVPFFSFGGSDYDNLAYTEFYHYYIYEGNTIYTNLKPYSPSTKEYFRLLPVRYTGSFSGSYASQNRWVKVRMQLKFHKTLDVNAYMVYEYKTYTSLANYNNDVVEYTYKFVISNHLPSNIINKIYTTSNAIVLHIYGSLANGSRGEVKNLQINSNIPFKQLNTINAVDNNKIVLDGIRDIERQKLEDNLTADKKIGLFKTNRQTKLRFKAIVDKKLLVPANYKSNNIRLNFKVVSNVGSAITTTSLLSFSAHGTNFDKELIISTNLPANWDIRKDNARVRIEGVSFFSTNDITEDEPAYIILSPIQIYQEVDNEEIIREYQLGATFSLDTNNIKVGSDFEIGKYEAVKFTLSNQPGNFALDLYQSFNRNVVEGYYNYEVEAETNLTPIISSVNNNNEILKVIDKEFIQREDEDKVFIKMGVPSGDSNTKGFARTDNTIQYGGAFNTYTLGANKFSLNLGGADVPFDTFFIRHNPNDFRFEVFMDFTSPLDKEKLIGTIISLKGNNSDTNTYKFTLQDSDLIDLNYDIKKVGIPTGDLLYVYNSSIVEMAFNPTESNKNLLVLEEIKKDIENIPTAQASMVDVNLTPIINKVNDNYIILTKLENSYYNNIVYKFSRTNITADGFGLVSVNINEALPIGNDVSLTNFSFTNEGGSLWSFRFTFNKDLDTFIDSLKSIKISKDEDSVELLIKNKENEDNKKLLRFANISNDFGEINNNQNIGNFTFEFISDLGQIEANDNRQDYINFNDIKLGFNGLTAREIQNHSLNEKIFDVVDNFSIEVQTTTLNVENYTIEVNTQTINPVGEIESINASIKTISAIVKDLEDVNISLDAELHTLLDILKNPSGIIRPLYYGEEYIIINKYLSDTFPIEEGNYTEQIAVVCEMLEDKIGGLIKFDSKKFIERTSPNLLASEGLSLPNRVKLYREDGSDGIVSIKINNNVLTSNDYELVISKDKPILFKLINNYNEDSVLLEIEYKPYYLNFNTNQAIQYVVGLFVLSTIISMDDNPELLQQFNKIKAYYGIESSLL